MSQPNPPGQPGETPAAATPQYQLPPQYQVPGYPGHPQAAPQYAPPQYAPPPYQPPQQYAPPLDLPQYVVPEGYVLPPAYDPNLGYAPPGSISAPPAYAPPYGFAQHGLPGPGGVFDGAAHPQQLNRPLYGAGIGASLARFFNNYVNFSGRASRAEFWWMMLLYWGVFWAGSIVAGIADAAIGRSNGVMTAYTGVFTLLTLAMFIPWLALNWRRLHDAGYNGALFLLSLIPFVGSIIVLVLTAMPPRPEGRRFDMPGH